MRACLIFAHQAAEPDNIRVQNGGELSLAGGRFSRRISRVIDQSAHRRCIDLAAGAEQYNR
jgi:hypothetical protein